MAPPLRSTTATVATSPYAMSARDTEVEDTKQTAKLVANGQYIVMAESGNRSKKGVDDLDNANTARLVPENPRNTQPEPVVYTKTLYDFPRDPSTTPRIEMYRRAHPSEVSAPMEFAAYLRDVGPASNRQGKVRFDLPTVEESMETLQALHTTAEMKTKRNPPVPTLRAAGDKAPLTEDDIP